jgi:hypothetical protein
MKKSIPILFLIFTLTFALIGGPVLDVAASQMAGGVDVSVDSDGKTGSPGAVVTYTLTIKNNNADTVKVEVYPKSSSGWDDPVASPDAFNLAAGKSKSVTVNVFIPDYALDGQGDITVVSVQSDTGTVYKKLNLLTSVKVEDTTGNVPLVSISSYDTGGQSVTAGSEFSLQMVLKNSGKATAQNIIVTFVGESFYPLESGGVQTIGKIDAGGKNTIVQKFIAGNDLAWVDVANIAVSVSYTDSAGSSYSSDFTISIRINEPIIYTNATPTPASVIGPQLVVTGYQTDVDPLQPGAIFNLALDVKNLGLADARAVTVVFGGGVTAEAGGETPQPGGLSGSEGDFQNFAPLGSSNIVFAGDINQQTSIKVSQKFVVNVTTEPGAYPFKLSFVYDDTKGNRLVDNQVITMLVYSLPQIEVSFYQDGGIYMAGTENMLPLQVTNLGRNGVVLGNMKVTAENAELYNNTLLIGSLEPGGYYTLDASIIPAQEGPLDLLVTINYTDDFNQARVYEQVIPIEILPMDTQPIDMGNGEATPPPDTGIPVTETFWQKLGRFFRGLFGLDSGIDQPTDVIPQDEYSPLESSPKG